MSGYTPPNQWDKMSNQNKLNIEREINETYRNAMMKYELNRELYIDQSDPYVTYEELTEMYNDAVAACNAYPPNTFLTWPQPLPLRGKKRTRSSSPKSMKRNKSTKPKSRRVKPKRTYI